MRFEVMVRALFMCELNFELWFAHIHRRENSISHNYTIITIVVIMYIYINIIIGLYIYI